MLLRTLPYCFYYSPFSTVVQPFRPHASYHSREKASETAGPFPMPNLTKQPEHRDGNPNSRYDKSAELQQ